MVRVLRPSGLHGRISGGRHCYHDRCEQASRPSIPSRCRLRSTKPIRSLLSSSASRPVASARPTHSFSFETTRPTYRRTDVNCRHGARHDPGLSPVSIACDAAGSRSPSCPNGRAPGAAVAVRRANTRGDRQPWRMTIARLASGSQPFSSWGAI